MTNLPDKDEPMMPAGPLARFMKSPSAGGILLMAATLLALAAANTPFSVYYDQLLAVPVVISVGTLEVAKPMLLWINDGLMALFFFSVGLELKREVLEGELSDPSNILMPAIGALGGMLVPVVVFWYFNRSNPEALQGWAIPAATDIAFAVGILSLLGSRVPTSLKVFLTSLAVLDDIGAVLIIAVFYTTNISQTALLVVFFCVVTLLYLNWAGVINRALYLTVGVIMWVAMLKSGVHATLSTVILALFIPLGTGGQPGQSPLKSLESELHGVVTFVVLPLFAFANAGVNLRGLTMDSVFHSVPVGIAAGLFLGKQAGIFGFCGLAVKTGLVPMPKGMNWMALWGIALLCGIGFTMSLFISSLAFENTGIDRFFDERIGILLGSLVSGVLGYIVLRKGLAKN